MRHLECPYLARRVDLTDERELHIEQSHRPLFPDYADLVVQTVLDPDFVCDRLGTAGVGPLQVLARPARRPFSRRSGHVGYDPARGAILGSDSLHRSFEQDLEADLESQLSLRYDPEGDILYLDTVLPYATQESDEIADGVVARMNPDSGEVENLEILFFSGRIPKLGDELRLPVGVRLTRPLAG